MINPENQTLRQNIQQEAALIQKKDSRRINIIYGALQSLYMSTNCAYFAFLVIYLNSVGYSEFQIGLAMTMVSIVSIVSPSIMGYLADYVFPIKSIVAFMMLISVPLAFTLQLTVSVFPLALLAITALGISERSMMSLLDGWGMKLRSKKPYLNYGLTRGVASLTFAVVALSLGQIYNIIGVDKLFWVHALFALLCVLAAILLDGVPTISRKKERHSYLHTMRLLLQNRQYVILLICMALHGLSMVTIHTFQPILVTELGGTSTHLGLALFIMAGSEAPVMFSSSWFLRRYRVESLLVVAYAFTVLRVLSSVLAPNLGWLIGFQAFQAISYGLYLPAILFYISLITSDEMKATAITLAISVGFGLSGILGNSIGGLIAQHYGVRMVYYIFSFLTFCALVLFSTSLICRKKSGREKLQSN